MISFVVARSSNNVIGVNNDLPWHLPADLKYFKTITAGHTVVMGRKTFQSIVDRLGKPLPGRASVVLTRDESFRYPGVDVIYSVDDLPTDVDLYVIGGEQIYRQLLDQAERLYVTEVKTDIEGDIYFPELSPAEWQEVSRQANSADAKNPYDYDFVVYERT